MKTSRRRELSRATRLAAALGKVMAIALAVLGVFTTNIWLVSVALVVWIGGRRAAATSRVRSSIVVPVSAAMHRADVVTPEQSLGEAARKLVETGQHELPIVDRGAPVGVLTRTDVAHGINGAGPQAPVASAPHHDAITVSPNTPLEGVVDRLAHAPNAIAVVVDGSAVVGVVTAQQLATYVALHAEHPTLSR